MPENRVYIHDMTIYEGEALLFAPHFEADISADSFKMYIKDNISGSAILKTIDGVVSEGTLEDDGVTINGYYVTFAVTPSEMSSLPSTCNYWINRTTPDQTKRIFMGKIARLQ
jgi:hypothetical protein